VAEAVSTGGPGVAAGRRLKMKELEARTGVGREAIRFYIREGMLPEPEKPRRNVAYYSEEHVRRLLLIRQLKEEREMSLARIKHVLDSTDFESLARIEPLKGVERLLPALVEGVLPSEDVPLDALAARTGLDREEIDALVAAGIVHPSERAGELWVGFREAAVVAKWGRIRSLGFTRENGYDLSTLLRYQALARELAELEVGQFLEAFSGKLAPEEAADIAAAAVKEASDIIVQLHVGAVLEALRERLE
jgi:DNA-binding transcriptional MerR regulator